MTSKGIISEGNDQVLNKRTEEISRERFIRLGGAIGVSVAGASVLAACGGGTSGQSANVTARNTTASGGGGPSSEPTDPKNDKVSKSEAKASGGKVPAGQEITQASKVPANSAVTFTDSGSPAVLIHLKNGRFVAYSAVCTHQGCTVAYQPSTEELACPCHGSVFDPSNRAAVVNGPAQIPLPSIPVKVQDGDVYRT
jgi:cytochrome b6-f complex iron-sulfur subunit